jgi:hypothetical protein
MRRALVVLAFAASVGLLATTPASEAKKKSPKCKRGFVRKGKRCVRKKTPAVRSGT